MHVARYLEENQMWPDGLPLVDEHGEFTRTAPRDVHYNYDEVEAAHGYQTHGHHSFMANDIEAADVDTSAGRTINIEGPVIIGGKGGQYDLASLLR